MLASQITTAAALSLLSLTSAQAQPAAPVQVINLASYSFAPSPIVLRAGRPVTLQFINRSGSGHDFTARNFFASARIISGPVANGEVELRGRQVANVTLIPALGRYPVYCSHPFHKVFGMKSTIVVQ